MRYLAAGALLTTVVCRVASPCSCVPAGEVTACSSLSGKGVAFLGRVVRDTGDGGWGGSRFGRMVVEEVFEGLPENLREVEVDTMAGTSCGMGLAQGERYVIFGRLDTHDPTLVHYGPCAASFNARGNDLLLEALHQAAAKGPPILVGRAYDLGYRSGIQGILVTAQGPGGLKQTATSASGEFAFRDLQPGEYTITLTSSDYVPDGDRGYGNLMHLEAHGCANRRFYVTRSGVPPVRGVPHQ